MRPLLFCVLSFAAAAPEFVLAQDQYKGIALPPYEFYEALVGYAQDADYDKLSRAAAYLSPLFKAVRDRFGIDVKAELAAGIEAKDDRKVLAAVYELLFLDMRINLEKAQNAAPQEKNQPIEMAYLDYRYLAARVKAKDKTLDSSIKADFKTAYRSAVAAIVLKKTRTILLELAPLFVGGNDEAH